MANRADQPQYDVVIIGAGISGSILAAELAAAGKTVLILDAGPAVPTNRAQYMENFYLSAAKTPESPYPPLALSPGTEANPRPTILGLNVWTDPTQSYLVQPTPTPPAPQGTCPSPAPTSASAAAPPGTGSAPRCAWCRTTSRCTRPTRSSAPGRTGPCPTRSSRSSTARRSRRSGSRRAWPSRAARGGHRPDLPAGLPVPDEADPALGRRPGGRHRGIAGLTMPSSDDKAVFLTPTPPAATRSPTRTAASAPATPTASRSAPSRRSTTPRYPEPGARYRPGEGDLPGGREQG